MKYIKLILIALCFTACDDYLDVEPKNERILKSSEEVKNMLGGFLLDPISTSYNLSQIYPVITDDNNNYFHLYSDNINLNSISSIVEDDLDRYLDDLIDTKDLQSSKFSGLLWKSYYSNIGFLNLILARSEEFRDQFTPEDYEIVVGEAKVIRAYSFFKLQQYFSPYKDNTLGIPMTTLANDIDDDYPKRATQQEVYNVIINDLTSALSYTTSAKIGYNIFYSKPIINGLLAQVYWYKGGSGAAEPTDYANAIKHAKNALPGKQIATIADINGNDLFRSPGNGSIFFRQNVYYKDNPFQHIIFSGTTGGLNKNEFFLGNRFTYYLEPSESLVSLYDEKDVRLSKNFNTTSEDVLGITKFYYSFTALNGVPFLRIADLQLIIAESYARQNDNTNAITALEGLQSNRIEDYTGYNGTDVLQEILDERRREFCYETDMRWIDMRRLGESYTRFSVDENGDAAQYEIMENDYRYTLPIPFDEERKFNKIEQNPGWPNNF